MATREDWIAAALILGGVVLVGILAWAVSKRGGGSRPREGIRLRRVEESRVVFRNLERRKVVRDSQGNIVELIIHREVERV